MATVRVPPNCQGMTLTTSGAVVASGNLITCTSLEATSLVSPYAFPGSQPVVSTSGQNSILRFPLVITNITINSVSYPLTAGISGNIPTVDAANFNLGGRQREPSFELVQG